MSKIPYNHKAIEKKWREKWEENPVNVQYDENGNKKEEFELVNGTQNGIAISYFENGLIHTKGDCVNGKYNGIFYQFTEK